MPLLMRVTDLLWNPWLLGAFLLTGLYASARTGFFQLFGLRTWMRATVGSILRPAGGGAGQGIPQVQALCTALASTIGTGSIAGVAAAIWLGGPGAVFWMWLSALLGMMTSFMEKTLAVKFRHRNVDGGWTGGPMYYLREGMGSRFLAGWFALACLCATLSGGSLIQSSSIAESLQAAFGWDRLAVGAALTVLTGLVMAGGLGRIAGVSTLMVPVMALLYVGGGTAVICARHEALPAALHSIFTCALIPQAAAGGCAGYTLSQAMRFGVARGVFTNEAGLGTSAMAHAAAQVDCPARQGMWGILEVGVSTLVVCTITALVILVSGVYAPQLGAAGIPPVCGAGAPLTAAAFASVLGPGGSAVVAVSLLLFAFSSILGWSYYGQQCLFYLTGRRSAALYRCVFLGTVFLGSVCNSTGAWLLVDLSNALMAIPNLAALLALSGVGLAELRRWNA